jgi:hypothetical protein
MEGERELAIIGSVGTIAASFSSVMNRAGLFLHYLAPLLDRSLMATGRSADHQSEKRRLESIPYHYGNVT